MPTMTIATRPRRTHLFFFSRVLKRTHKKNSRLAAHRTCPHAPESLDRYNRQRKMRMPGYRFLIPRSFKFESSRTRTTQKEFSLARSSFFSRRIEKEDDAFFFFFFLRRTLWVGLLPKEGFDESGERERERRLRIRDAERVVRYLFFAAGAKIWRFFFFEPFFPFAKMQNPKQCHTKTKKKG